MRCIVIRYSELLVYGRQYGTFDVPITYEIPGSLRKLGSWLSSQRQKRKKGALKPDRCDSVAHLISSAIICTAEFL